MSRICEICSKSYERGHTVSHSNNRNLRRWQPNLKRVRAKIGKLTRQIRVCTACLKAGKVTKAA